MNTSRFKWFFCLLFAFLLWTLFYIPYLPFHILHQDTSGYILTAKMILNGAVPFLDFWDNKPPFVYFLYALILKVFGINNFIPINYVSLCFYFISTLALYTIVRKLISSYYASIVSIFYPVFTNLLLARDAVNPNAEIYMLSFMLVGLSAGIHGILKKRPVFMVYAGLSIGIASAFKQPCVFYLAVLSAGWIIFYEKKTDIRIFLRSMALLGAAFFSVWAMIVFYFWYKNALWDFWFLSFGFNFLYCGDISQKKIIESLGLIYYDFIRIYPIIFIPYIFGLGSIIVLLIRRRTNRFLWGILLLWHCADIAAVSVGGLFYYHYFIHLIPSLTAVTFLPILRLIQNRGIQKRWWIRCAAGIYCSIILYQVFTPRNIFVSTDPCRYIPPVQAYRHAKMWADINGAEFFYYPYYRPPKTHWQITEYIKLIRSHVPPDKPIFVWGSVPDIYLMSNRKPASRFIYASFITGKFYGLSNLYCSSQPSLTEYLDKISGLLLSDFSANQPEMIIVTDREQLSHTAFFWNYLRDNYSKLDVKKRLPVDLYIKN